MQVPVEKIVVREREVPVEKVVEQLEEEEIPVPVEKVSLDACFTAPTASLDASPRSLRRGFPLAHCPPRCNPTRRNPL